MDETDGDAESATTVAETVADGADDAEPARTMVEDTVTDTVASATVDETDGETVTDAEAATESLTVTDPDEETFAEAEALDVDEDDRATDTDLIPEPDRTALRLARFDDVFEARGVADDCRDAENDGPVDTVQLAVEELEKALLRDADADGDVITTARIRLLPSSAT